MRAIILLLFVTGCATQPCQQNISAQVKFPEYEGKSRVEAHDYLDDYLDDEIDVSTYGKAEEAAAKCAVELNYCTGWVDSVRK